MNVHGRLGCNIPVDLHMEHLNRRLKCMMRNLGSKHTSISYSQNCKIFRSSGYSLSQAELEASVSKGYCSYPSFAKDFNQILHVLEEQKVYEVQEGRTLKIYASSPLLSGRTLLLG